MIQDIHFVKVSYRGHIYQVPACSTAKEQLEISDFRFQSEHQSYQFDAGAFRFFLSPSTSSDIKLSCSVSGDDCPFDEVFDLSIGMFLYREGEEMPLSMVEECVHFSYDCNFDLEVRRELFKPGRYFLLAKNLNWKQDGTWEVETLNGHLLWSFTVMQGGDELVHPNLLSVEWMPLLQWTSGDLKLKLTWGEILPAHSEWKLSCYADSWQLMGTAVRYLSPRQCGIKDLNFCLQTSKVWLPGEYFAVLSHNTHPYASFSFTLSEQGGVSYAIHRLADTDLEYWMVKQIEHQQHSFWQKVNDWPGLGTIRPRIIQLHRDERYNLFCEHHQKMVLKENRYAVVTAADVFHAKRLAYCLSSLLHFGTASSKLLNVAEWVEDTDAGEEVLTNRENTTIIVYGLSALIHHPERRAELILSIVCQSIFCAFILCGTEEELRELFQLEPMLCSWFPGEVRFAIQPPSLLEQICAAHDCLKETSMYWSLEAEHQLAYQFGQHWNQVQYWVNNELQDFVLGSVVSSFRRRLHRMYRQYGEEKNHWDLCACQAEDVNLQLYLEEQAILHPVVATKTFDESFHELNQLVGLSHLKQELAATFDMVQFSKIRSRLGLSGDTDGVHHMIFTGNPGTGKTTVAKLIGQIYHAMGILSKGEVIVTERTQLLGRYIGETEEKMKNLLERAQGNVLFIDEAYTLIDTAEDRKDFGHHVIESLLTVLAKPNPDMLIIMAGYAHEMDRMMQVNQGLAGRFPHQFHFADYSADELMQIALHLLQQKQFTLTEAAARRLQEIIEETLSVKDRYFSNARWVHRLVESGILPAMARRVMQISVPPSAALYSVIEEADVQAAAVKMAVLKKSIELVPRRRIGFIA